MIVKMPFCNENWSKLWWNCLLLQLSSALENNKDHAINCSKKLSQLIAYITSFLNLGNKLTIS